MTVTISNYDLYLEESLEHLKSYIQEMKSRPILFVGSGFSRRYINSPNWQGLLEQLIDDNPEINLPIEYFLQEHNGDLASIASQLVEFYRDYAWKNHNNDELFPAFLFKSPSKSIFLKYKISRVLAELMETFDNVNDYADELKLIQRLNPQAIITTNYDTLLEKLFPKYEPIVGQQVIHAKKATDIGHILKIHGSVEIFDDIITQLSQTKLGR